jgi:hypothetical protein
VDGQPSIGPDPHRHAPRFIAKSLITAALAMHDDRFPDLYNAAA